MSCQETTCLHLPQSHHQRTRDWLFKKKSFGMRGGSSLNSACCSIRGPAPTLGDPEGLVPPAQGF